jgi:hypothetical protein
MKKQFSPIHRPGLEVLAGELDRQAQLNSELLAQIQEKDLKIQELERIIRSYQSNSVPEVIM